MNTRMVVKSRCFAAAASAGALWLSIGTGQLCAEGLDLVEAPPTARVSPAVELMVKQNEPVNIPQAVVVFPENLTLEQAMALALSRNPDILRAIAEIQRTEGTILEVQAQALPQVNVNASYTQQDENLNEFGGGGPSSGGQQQGQEQTQEPGQAQASGQGQGQGQGGNQQGQPAQGQQQPGQTQQGQQAQAPEQPEESQGAGQAGGESQGISGFGGGTENWRVAVEINQLLYSGGRVGAARRAAVLASSNALLDLQETINSILSEVVREFYQIVLDRELLQVEQENVDLLTRQLEEAQIRREAEVVADFNVLRARVELANAQPNLIRARNELELNKLRLARTLGLDPQPAVVRDNLLNPIGDLPNPEALPDLEGALATAYRERPLFLTAIQNIQLREAQKQVAFSGYLPELRVSGGYEFRNSSLSDDLGDTVDGWFFGFSGSWALFDGFRTRGQLKQARAQIQQAELDYLGTKRQIALSVEEAWFRLKTAKEVVESQQLSVEQSREALRLSRARLDAGTGTQLEVLDTRVAWLRSNVILLESLYEYRVSLAEFRRVTGLISRFHLDVSERPLVAPASKRVIETESVPE